MKFLLDLVAIASALRSFRSPTLCVAPPTAAGNHTTGPTILPWPCPACWTRLLGNQKIDLARHPYGPGMPVFSDPPAV